MKCSKGDIMIRILAIVLFLCFFAALESAAAVVVPRQKLSVSFDLAAHRLVAESIIEVPPGCETVVSLQGLDIKGMILDEQQLEFEADRQELALGASPTGHRLTLTYEKTVSPDTPQAGLIGEAGIVLLGDWHPVLATDTRYALSALLPVGFEAVSEADQIEKKEEGNGIRVTFAFPHPLPAIDLVAGPYQVESVAFGDGKKLYSYFFAEDADLAEHYREKALEYLTRYEKLIGPYPYERFSIVENRLPTGYAMPTFTLLGQAVVRLPFIVDTSLGHEVLHAWFGNAVSPVAGTGNWSEGLATALADYTFAEEKGEGLDYRQGQTIRYQSFTSEGRAISLREFSGADTGGDLTSQVVRSVGYDKAAMVFYMLRQAIGEDAFIAGLRDFYRRLKYQRAGWDDLQTSFEESSNSNLHDFFVQWTERSDVPSLVVEKPRLVEEEGLPVVMFTLKQMTETPYRLTVPLEFRFADGVVSKIVQTDLLEKQVAIPLGKVPRFLAVDPEYQLLRRLVPNEYPAVWSRFVGAGTKLVVRAKNEDSAVYESLERVLVALGCEIKNEDEVTDTDLAAGAVLFLGVDSDRVRSLFGALHPVREGITVAVRHHPLHPGSVAVLVSASSGEEVAAAANRLRHYSKYSFLRFVGGRVVEKTIEETVAGQVYRLDQPPVGAAVTVIDPFEAIIDSLMNNRVVHVGESHTTWSDHQLQFRIIRALHEKDSRLAIGMEMFSREVQPVLDKYIAGTIDEKEFLKQSGYFSQWGYDYRLYRDILKFARRYRISVVGLNLPKALVSKVFKEGGVDVLTDEEAQKIPRERDLDMPGYQQRLAMVFAMHGQHGSAGGAFKDFFQAQSLWDEAMAETAASFLAEHPEHRMVVLAGRGHVVKDTGIPPRLARRVAGLSQAVVVNTLGDDLDPTLTDYVFFAEHTQLPPAPAMGVRLIEEEGRVRIVEATEKSAAARAGVMAGDLIISLDGHEVTVVDDIKIAMLDKKAGDTVTLEIQRPGFFGRIDTVLLPMEL